MSRFQIANTPHLFSCLMDIWKTEFFSYSTKNMSSIIFISLCSQLSKEIFDGYRRSKIHILFRFLSGNLYLEIKNLSIYSCPKYNSSGLGDWACTAQIPNCKHSCSFSFRCPSIWLILRNNVLILWIKGLNGLKDIIKLLIITH